jgi:hypothetical protein
VKFQQCDRLLDPTPLALEMGYERLDDGVLHVAARTDMHQCTGAMFEWWFRSRPGTREYVWWHPLDHVSSEWREFRPDTHVGSIHQVVEGFTGSPPEPLSIQFRDPEEFFDPAGLSAARSSGAVSVVICARAGPGFEPRRGADGAIIGSRMIHLGRDTPWGLALRSHFFLGHDLPSLGASPAELVQMLKEDHAPRLLQHCYDEFRNLSQFLPSLYAAEARTAEATSRAW